MPHFLDASPYWGEISQPVLREILDACRTRPWREALRARPEDEVRRAYEMMTNTDRANFSLLLPLPRETAVLDVGAGSGANAHGLALRYARVVAVEPVEERTEFMRLRFEQEGLGNVQVIRSGTTCLPFHPGSFDLIVLNGVLEWIPWSDRNGSPREVQRRTLARLLELLRPGGWLYVGIENRLHLDYALGARDPHADIPWVTLLPRAAADWVARRRTGEPYRTHIHSYWGYRRLLRDAGFDEIRIYQAIDSYNHPRFFVPCRDPVARSFEERMAGPARSWKHAVARRVLRWMCATPFVGYAFAMFARRPGGADVPRGHGGAREGR